MPDLIAQGTENSHRWRRSLEDNHSYIIGRASGTWSVPWDQHISRRHAEVIWHNGELEVRLLSEARNPIFVRGRQRDHFTLKPGEHFVIGGTSFTLSDARAQVTGELPVPVTEHTYSPVFLQRSRFRFADQRIDVLSRLPEVIAGSASDMELFVRLVNVLLAGIPGASAVALVAVEPAAANSPIQVLHWDRRVLNEGDFTPSERLIRQATERQESVVHLWRGDTPIGEGSTYTQTAGLDWAFCTPVPGDACRGWAIYVAGQARHHHEADSDTFGLRDDLKFTELAATTLSNVREVRTLERQQAGLRQFFSPVVLDALAGQDPDIALAPREAEVTVMFCDLRGFSRSAEQSANDLLGLLRRVSRALGVVTNHIRAQGGVVGDFHGDAAMGFWGWPLAQEDLVERACRAALAIRADFVSVQQSDPELVGFRVGIGIATGRAVAGKIGTIDQVKVTVFGPVVNLASRLEAMTRRLQTSILIDEPTAEIVKRTLRPHEARMRRVARVKPYGLESPLMVTELLPPADQYPQLSNEHIEAYELALEALLSRDWQRAFQLLHRVPADDLVKDFLTVFIAQHNRTPPAWWEGFIPLDSK